MVIGEDGDASLTAECTSLLQSLEKVCIEEQQLSKEIPNALTLIEPVFITGREGSVQLPFDSQQKSQLDSNPT